MVLPKKAAEAYLPPLAAKQVSIMDVDDMDGQHTWSIKFRYWLNNNSRMYVFENTGDFVDTHGLKQGDYMMLYQDIRTKNYVIGARKSHHATVEGGTKSEFSEWDLGHPGECFVNDVEMNVFNEVDFPNQFDSSAYNYESTLTSDTTTLFDFSNSVPQTKSESFDDICLEELMMDLSN